MELLERWQLRIGRVEDFKERAGSVRIAAVVVLWTGMLGYPALGANQSAHGRSTKSDLCLEEEAKAKIALEALRKQARPMPARLEIRERLDLPQGDFDRLDEASGVIDFEIPAERQGSGSGSGTYSY